MGKCKSCEKNTCQYCIHRRWFFGWYCERERDLYFIFGGAYCPSFVEKLRYLG